MSVGAVAGHLFLVLRSLDKHLDASREPSIPGPAPANASQQWPRIETPGDLDRPDSIRVRADGDHVAAWGWEAVRSAYVSRTEKLAGRLAGPLPAAVTFGAAPMDFGDYLVTRIVELLVHADDLAASVGLPPPQPPAEAASIAIEVLTEGARQVYGDLEVLRALTRPERTLRPVPSVY
jgi:Mycothiol maleylpyruvate isomerase N-terminal domain